MLADATRQLTAMGSPRPAMRRAAALAATLAWACGGEHRASHGEADAGGEVDAGRAAPIHVLFIGNSLTSVNDLPGMLSRLSAPAGEPPAIETEQIAPGGATLGTHRQSGVAEERIARGGLTHVVIQGQSEEPLRDGFAEDAAWFGELAVAAGAVPVYFDTWARTDGGAVFSPLHGGFTIDRSMTQDYFTQAYAEAAARWPGGLVACAGEAFRFVLDHYPEIDVQQPDHVHPTVTGTYLAAATFHVALIGQPVPETSEIPVGVDPGDAATLRSIALVTGSHCTSVRARSLVVISPCVNGACAVQDIVGFGSSATPVTMTFLVVNMGGTAATLRAFLFPADFGWTEGDAFPGRSTPFDYRSRSYAPCTDRLEPQAGGPLLGSPDSACAISITYRALATATGELSIVTDNGYREGARQIMTGTALP